jgi:hypothetical protein
MGHRRGRRGLVVLIGEVAMLWLLRPVLGLSGDAVARAAANRSGSWGREE